MINGRSYTPSQLPYYTEDQLYYMTEAEFSQVCNRYRDYKNIELQHNRRLTQELNAILLQEAADKAAREERLRIEAEQQAERARLARIEDNNRRIREQQEANQRALEAQQKREAEIKQQAAAAKAIIDAQNAEIQRVNDQKKEIDHWNTEKTKTDAAKHANALENQQPHVQIDLQPSAPPVEEKQKQCACGNKMPAKPLHCGKCKKQLTDICGKCSQDKKGQCSECWQNWQEVGKYTQTTQGECCIGAACCSEEQGVTPIPCKHCKVGADRICKACLKGCVELNTTKNQTNRCPHCGSQNALDGNILKTILTQK